jgi:putative NADH-flavin reductase
MSKIIVFGARGRMGRHAVSEALRRGHEVTAVVRESDALESAEGLEVVVGDVADVASVAALATGHDAAVSALGPRAEDERAALGDHWMTLIEGLEQAGVGRLVIVGGAGSLEVEGGGRLVDTPDFHEQWKRTALAHADGLERLQASDSAVDWAYFSPGALFDANGERTGEYRLSGDEILIGEDGRSYLSYADGAVVVIDEIEQDRHHRRRFHAAK